MEIERLWEHENSVYFQELQKQLSCSLKDAASDLFKIITGLA